MSTERKKKKEDSKTLNSIAENKGFSDIQDLNRIHHQQTCSTWNIYESHLGRRKSRWNEECQNEDYLSKYNEPSFLVFKYLYRLTSLCRNNNNVLWVLCRSKMCTNNNTKARMWEIELHCCEVLHTRKR